MKKISFFGEIISEMELWETARVWNSGNWQNFLGRKPASGIVWLFLGTILRKMGQIWREKVKLNPNDEILLKR